MGNYDDDDHLNTIKCVIPLREKMGNYDNWLFLLAVGFCYTITRENGELRQCLCPQYSVMISPHIISAFTVCVNPLNGEKRF